MSTTFDVIPVSRVKITFGEVLKLSQKHVNQFLDDFEIEEHFDLQAELIGDSARRDARLDEDFVWSQNACAWITVQNISGGTDVYCRAIKDENDPDDPWWYLDVLRGAPNYSAALEEHLLAAREHNVCWTFRRSAGQPAIINVAYGLIAASLAELTDGLVYSDDNAWDYEVFPASGPEFRDLYFRPEATSKPERSDWVERCLASLRPGESELQGSKARYWWRR